MATYGLNNNTGTTLNNREFFENVNKNQTSARSNENNMMKEAAKIVQAIIAAG